MIELRDDRLPFVHIRRKTCENSIFWNSYSHANPLIKKIQTLVFDIFIKCLDQALHLMHVSSFWMTTTQIPLLSAMNCECRCWKWKTMIPEMEKLWNYWTKFAGSFGLRYHNNKTKSVITLFGLYILSKVCRSHKMLLSTDCITNITFG